MSEAPVIIIGGGLAGATAASELRERGYGGAVTLIAGEEHLPYERPPLSKDFLQGSSELPDFTVHDAQWYAKHDIDLLLGTRVEAIDRTAKRVTLDGGGTLDYAQLVLATGSRANPSGGIEGADLPGVRVLRTIDDARALREDLKEGTRLVIVGSGWIGMEAAASARQQGAEVTVISPSRIPLGNVLGEPFGNHLTRMHQEAGVQFELATHVDRIERGADQLVVHAGSWQTGADLVLLAIGASPHLEVAAASGIETDHGVVVDASLRSSDPDVLAVGDIAQAFNTTLRRQLRVEHWDNAIRQGKLAAATLTGTDEQYDWLPYFFTDQFELGMEYVGDRQDGDADVVRGDMDEGEFIMFWLREGRITAAMNVNIWDVNDTLRSLVGQRIDPERLQDTSIELGQLAAGQ